MVVRECCADGFVSLEVATRSEETKLRRAERVLLGKDQSSVVVASHIVISQPE
jgi:hypothetical protein